MLLPVADPAQAIVFTDKLRAQLQRQPFYIAETAITLSFSAGVIAVSHNNHNIAVLLTLADNALYEAKCAGRGKTFVATLPIS